MEGLWTNRRASGDFFINGLNMYSSSVSKVDIAVAFFTDGKIVENMISENGCLVRMVVRLGFPTKPSALRALINKPGIEIRYYSDRAFHPKLYIFGDKIALLGSANLTESALLTNQEIMVSIESEDPRFDELAALFSDYWDNSKILTSESLDAYEEVCEKYGKALDDISHIDKDIQSKIGKASFPNRVSGEPTKSKENIQTTEQQLVRINLRGIMGYGIPEQSNYLGMGGQKVKNGEVEVLVDGKWVAIGSVRSLDDGRYRVSLRKNRTFNQFKALNLQITRGDYDDDYKKILRMRSNSQEEAEQVFEEYMRLLPGFESGTLRFI